MEILANLMILTLTGEVQQSHDPVGAYCQNLYWQTNAENKLREAGCDIQAISDQINYIQSGRYE